nr:TIM-barrel domain-containing protein [Candidatus Acidoferrales bacterium]
MVPTRRNIPRREALRILGACAAGAWVGEPFLSAADNEVRIAGKLANISTKAFSKYTVRITISEQNISRQMKDAATPVADDGALAASAHNTLNETLHGALQVRIARDPLEIHVETSGGRVVQVLKIDEATGSATFQLGDGSLLGLGEGGPQFDRRGDVDRMRSGQGGYRLRTNGGRVPIQWLIGTSGWAMFIHQPLGTFDLSGPEGIFHPPADAPLPLDIFVVDASDPAQAMSEYAQITGHPEMPPLWALGFQQSHRTLAGADEILGIAKTYREKKFPCDTLIYLGTGFTPSGWNTQNGSFQFNPHVFADPKRMIDNFHALHFHIVLHAVILTSSLYGTVADGCALPRFDEEQAACYWDAHRKDFALGVDGWWPDEGDPLDAASRLTRIRMYWEGSQIDRPNQRPFALHRNGYAGMQRYAPFLWSGDVYSTWETLKTHVPIGINTGLSGIPLWGTDTGGFVPTKELTGELFVRWFQFSAFCPLFRSHGRDWKLRLPWGWNTGELGPNEVSTYGDAANPDPSELHNADVEPICRKYLELRYRLLPYLYNAVREGHDTGLPIMRALWLHYADDPRATACGDEYLWGRDILVAPVTEKTATSKNIYLPRGSWFDFWTEEKIEGGRDISRDVDLATLPLYVRTGSIVPLGPVKQYTSEIVDAPTTFVIYPGGDAACSLYEDDGASFNYRRGEWTRTEAKWNNATRKLSLRASGGSKTPYKRRTFEVRIAGEHGAKSVEFGGREMEVQF